MSPSRVRQALRSVEVRAGRSEQAVPTRRYYYGNRDDIPQVSYTQKSWIQKQILSTKILKSKGVCHVWLCKYQKTA
jgi:hypothetical protein